MTSPQVTWRSRLGVIGAVAGLGALGLVTTVGVGTSYAANGGASGATIDHITSANGTVRMLVSVPGTAPIDLASVGVTIGGVNAPAQAQSANTATTVARTTMLAIDTSGSMRGARIAAAKQAALTFLSLVPANVKVGVVSFNSTVTEPVAPTLDRTVAKNAISKLTLALQTKLYAGVVAAVKDGATVGGGDTQRQVIVLSDGQDTTGTPLASVTKAIRAAKVRLDVVGVDQTQAGLGPLKAMAAAGKGKVLNTQDPKAISAAFSSEASALARQVLVTAKVPASVTETDTTVALRLRAASTTYSVQAYSHVQNTPVAPIVTGPVPASAGALSLSPLVMFSLIGGFGALVVIMLLVLAFARKSKEPHHDLAERIGDYGFGGPRRSRHGNQGNVPLGAQAKQVVERMLANNRSLEARIAARLEPAGMAMRPAEWILLHIGIALVSAIAGGVLGGGSVVLALIFLAFGAVGPWIYLGLKRSRRLRAFNSHLPDTLQLMSGSLSAGLSLAQSVDTIVREGVDPISSEFKRVLVESRLGVSLEDSMEGVSQRMESKDFGWVVMAIRIQREVGGNLAELLLTVAETLREREYLRRQVRALSAEGRLSCYVLGSLPPAFLVYLTLTKPTYVHPLYSTAVGYLMLVGMVILLGVGVLWMGKVSKVEV